jgi:hypothetical protein
MVTLKLEIPKLGIVHEVVRSLSTPCQPLVFVVPERIAHTDEASQVDQWNRRTLGSQTCESAGHRSWSRNQVVGAGKEAGE